MPAKTKSQARVGLEITAQQSRFHKDSVELEAPTTKEILIKNLSITLGGLEILSRAELFLKENRKYVMVGRNGVGKSTLLKAIADGSIPGIPYSLNILLLGQTRDLNLEEAVAGLKIKSETVLEHVIRGDRRRERLLHEAEILSKGLDSQTDATGAVSAFRVVRHERLQHKLEESRRLAERRSGARGLKARQELISVEEEIVQSQASLDEDLNNIDTTVLSEQTKGAVDMLSEVQSSLDLMDAAAAEAKAWTVLLGIGFSQERVNGPVTSLSGGWKTRCELACALCQNADVILLDEPTNFLDLPSIIWLEQYVTELQDTTVVVVTHDRAFADAVGEELLVMRKQTLEKFKGNLSTYESEKHKKIKWLTSMSDAQDKQKAHMEKSIQNNMAAAKKTGDDKKLKQAVSKKKKLDERSGMQVNDKGHRFKLNRDLVGYHLTNRAGFDIPDFDPPAKIRFPSIPPDLRFPGALVHMESVSYAYPARAGKKPVLILNEINLTMHPGERAGICGLNGSGKTTVISLLIGEDENGSTVKPSKGTITRHARAHTARFSQQVVEQLEAFGKANPEMTSLKHLMESADGRLAEKDARMLLGSLGLHGQLASDVPIVALSGGQKVRLAFAKLVWNPPHLLVLDEVSRCPNSSPLMHRQQQRQC